TLSLTVSPSPATVGGTASGTATIAGATTAAGGSVTYTVFSESTCATQLTATNNPSTLTVTNGVVPASAAIAMNAAGTVYWQAVSSGDGNNNGGASPCVALPVAKLSPTISLSVSATKNPMRAGATANGTASLSGATSTAGGSVTYAVYTDSGC